MSSNEAAGWEHLESDAQMGVHAWATTRAGAFAQAALGVFALIARPEEIQEREHREVRAQADSPERLLVGWINECLYVHEIEGFVVRRVEVDACTESVVHGVLHGEEVDAERHRLHGTVKAATLRGVAVTESSGLHDVRVMMDL